MTGEPKRASKNNAPGQAAAASPQPGAIKSSLVRDHVEAGGGGTKPPGKNERVESSSGAAWIGRIIDDRYEVLELLAEGGMGAVFRAKHLKLLKDVAIKVIRPEFAGDGDIAARFAREAMATARFEHPHVASATDFGTLAEGGAYLVIQLVRGHSLTKLLETDGRFPWARAVEIGAQIADALSAAAAQGIVHRDLKPDNVIIERRDDGGDLIKILDFGIARHTRDSIPAPAASAGGVRRKLTREGAIVGTPGYMAPEQAMGDRADHTADLYALGVVLWECIAGRQLWGADDLSEMVMRQLTEPIPALRTLLPDDAVPEELDQLLSQLMAVSPKARPAHAGLVRDLLRQFALAGTGLVSLRTALSEGNTGVQPLPGISDGALRAALATPKTATPPQYGATSGARTTPLRPVGPNLTPVRTPTVETPARPQVAESPDASPSVGGLLPETQTISSLQTAPTQIVEAPPIDPSDLKLYQGLNPPAQTSDELNKVNAAVFGYRVLLKKAVNTFLYLFASTALFLIFVLSIILVLSIRGEDPFQQINAFGNYVPDIPSVIWQMMQQAGSRLAEPVWFKQPDGQIAPESGDNVAQVTLSKTDRRPTPQRISNKIETPRNVIREKEPQTPEEAPHPGPIKKTTAVHEPDKVPRELEDSADVLTTNKPKKDKTKAAAQVLAYRPASQVPKYLLALAHLQKSQTCASQKEAVLALTEIGDPRALPALRRLSGQRHTGCGPKKARDCLGCMRKELVNAIHTIESR